ncbi:type VII secretion system-associated protein [Nocardia sp. NPDC057455]|uniref:type VII secretion system-associated protein n=1 Tax=Nocardia sp. NPDC057455 TaxID=3346138 RepID=UPI003672A012
MTGCCYSIPGWKPATPWSKPPTEAVVGGWIMVEGGEAGPFQPNPEYLPGDDETPTDPTDALLRSVAAGKPVGDELLAPIRDSVVEIACDEQDQPIVDTAPDGVPCVLVATAEAQKVDVGSDRWWPIARLDPAVPRRQRCRDTCTTGRTSIVTYTPRPEM